MVQAQIAELHVDDVGTEIRLTLLDDGVPVDLTGASELTILLRKPSGTVVAKTASVVGEPANGVIHCYTATEDLDEAGLYEIQTRIAVGSWSGHSDIRRVRVYANVE